METNISLRVKGIKTRKKMDFEERVKRKNEFDASLVYGTKKFNLLTKRDKHVNYRKAHDDQWVDPKTKVISSKYAELRKCPLCGANKYENLFVKSGFPHVKCKICDLTYVNPILNRQEYEKLWTAEDSWENILESDYQIKMQTLEACYSLDIVELYMKKRKNVAICDVGCGPGTLLEEAKKRGYQVFGIEPNTRCHASLKAKEIDYIGDFFPLKDKIGRSLDCIFLLNTLEHMRNPMQIVLEAKKLLRNSGILYISVPCIDALVNRIMHEKAGVFGGHSHLQFFNIKTLSMLSAKAGFRVLDHETIITEIGVIKNYLSFKDPYFGDGGEDLSYVTPEIIYKNHLARNLNMVIRLR